MIIEWIWQTINSINKPTRKIHGKKDREREREKNERERKDRNEFRKTEKTNVRKSAVL